MNNSWTQRIYYINLVVAFGYHVFNLYNRKDLGSTPDRSTRISFFQVCLCHSLNNTSLSLISCCNRNDHCAESWILFVVFNKWN